MTARGTLEGVGAAPGRALGRIHRLDFDVPAVAHRTIAPDEVDAELARFDAARAASRKRLESLASDTATRLGQFEGRMFEAQAWMIDDPMIVDGTVAYIRENFLSAERAFELQMLENRVRMVDSGQAMVLDRLADLQDVRTRVLAALLGLDEPELPETAGDPLILVGRDLPPSLAARLDTDQVVGFVTAYGSRGAHSVVIARSLGIAAVVGIGRALEGLEQGTMLLMDGRTGRLITNPSDADMESFRQSRVRIEERRVELEETAGSPTVTTDGVELSLQANVDRPDEVLLAERLGADGIGLFRSEFLVIGHREIPSEEEQYEAYRAALEALPDRVVTLRTFDIGGDKFPLFLDMPREDNPYLGWRAIRVCLDLPDLFMNQLRGAIRAAPYGNLRLLLPFITSIDEITRTRVLLSEVYDSLGADGPESPVPLGIMIETPAALELIDRIAPLVDFVSLGTNDLTQYVLAADRGNAKLAGIFDALHPALVAMYRRLAAACMEHELDLSVCGELAGEPAGLALLVGLGYRSFSMSLAALGEQRELARSVSAADLAKFVDGREWDDAASCRAALTTYLAEHGVRFGDGPRLSEN
ncbi:MAG: phosphoenolpyruvate--protein phosphotransferase [Gemmatimonadota bacterium]